MITRYAYWYKKCLDGSRRRQLTLTTRLKTEEALLEKKPQVFKVS